MKSIARLACSVLVVGGAWGAAVTAGSRQAPAASLVDVAAYDRDRVVKAADAFLAEPPVTITVFRAEESAGGIHD